MTRSGTDRCSCDLQAVLFVLTKHFLQSQFCLSELRWALDQRQQQLASVRSQHAASGIIKLMPLFYRSDQQDMGLPLWDGSSWGALSIWHTLCSHHSDADAAQVWQWTQDVITLSTMAGPRQDSVRK